MDWTLAIDAALQSQASISSIWLANPQWGSQPAVTDVESENQNISSELLAHRAHSSSYLFRNWRKDIHVQTTNYLYHGRIQSLRMQPLRMQSLRMQSLWIIAVQSLWIQSLWIHSVQCKRTACPLELNTFFRTPICVVAKWRYYNFGVSQTSVNQWIMFFSLNNLPSMNTCIALIWIIRF